MSKTSRRPKVTPFPPWATRTPGGIEKRFIRIGDTFILSEAFQKLNHAAAIVYINMMMEAGPAPTFEMPRHKYERFISRGGFKKAVEELVGYGFIEIAENNAHRKKPNVYRFAEGWKEWPKMTDRAVAGDGTAKMGK